MLLGLIMQIKMLTFSFFLLLLITNSFGETEKQPKFVCPEGWLDETLYGLGWKILKIIQVKIGYFRMYLS